ncbi:coproporphyrinogen III oxidase [Thermoflavimicrobium dichotomicum]|uniref:Oxygen-independent coproporphyrinogen-3 oxidase n=1 Tax=Thermoflavimicrobium dichotomicum TaxID=46223 RepID=A0A1I3T206_9BACL|nr:coproporphyrinogen III oxidase [Thermoflavimicrobium dichotomicum]SFJ64199.1 oxygen-independent coproporphyrinogen-3 oxidase [Thermoflavimicrobium dichotomicum]
MQIRLEGLRSEFYREIELIASLFFEEVKVTDSLEEQVQAVLQFQIETGNPVSVGVTLTDEKGEQKWHASHQRAIEASDEKSYRKRLKKVISYAVLQVLQQATGVIQPWGILTGVRPTKLLHTMLLNGKTIEEASGILAQDYLLQPHKIEILKEIVERQHAVLPDLYELDRKVSLYIGIPFCPTKCAYCTFPAYAIRGRNGSVEEFLAGLHEEIEAVGSWLKERNLPVTTIYYGGGTPTSISVEQMDALFTQMKRWIPFYDQVREITVEAGRPDTLDPEKLDLLKRWQIDRISINPQSFKEETLKLIGRHHTVKETLEKYQLAREMGIDNINMDLIIGLPNEGVAEFKQSLEVVERLRPESLTVHTLSFKRGSIMTQNKEKYRVAERDEVEEMVRLAREWTQANGYVPYYLYRQKNILGNQENVGYAFPGQESLYNIIIMEERQTIIGLGCGAVSKIVAPQTGKIKRWPNPKEPQAYINTYRQHITGKLQALDEVYGFEMPMSV